MLAERKSKIWIDIGKNMGGTIPSIIGPTTVDFWRSEPLSGTRAVRCGARKASSEFARIVRYGLRQCRRETKMVDRVSPEQRSAIMRSVQTKDTVAEMALRRMLHRLGYRYRLHRRGLPGHPDIVFPVRKKAIFVHGCFWHGHSCPKGRLPKSRLEYWQPKIASNRERDARTLAALERDGWGTFVVWQCELREPGHVLERTIEFLERE